MALQYFFTPWFIPPLQQPLHLHRRLLQNFQLLKNRLLEIQESQLSLEEEIQEEVGRNRERDRAMNSIKPQIMELKKGRDEVIQ